MWPLRLHVRLTPESESLLDDGRIQRELRRSGVFHVAGVRKEVAREGRTRLGKGAEGMTALELLGQYFESRDVDAARREELMQMARGIVEGGQ